MPLVNIDLLEGRTDQDLRLSGDSVHQAMVEQLGYRSGTGGHGSFVTMEFGEPAVEVGEPRLLPLAIEGAPPRVVRRTAHVRGPMASMDLLLPVVSAARRYRAGRQ